MSSDATPSAAATPNIVLVMCDDLGYGDTGFNGNRIIQTPHLDALRTEGARFTRFYAGGPVCSPTRGTCLTGRHYSRYGITHANAGWMRTEEVTLATICQKRGYHTGHFGKWHLGTLTTTEPDSNRGGPDHTEEFSPPWRHGFETCFSSEAKVPTWDPMTTPDEKRGDRYAWGEPGTPFGTHYWNERGEKITDNLDGDDSRVIVDRFEPFVRDCARAGTPFFAVVWFHAPHTPVVAGPDYRALYTEHSEEEQHYYGCITAMDEQVGRINSLLKELGLEEDTALWFCSDNGPEGSGIPGKTGRSYGSTAGLRGRKRSLFDGGIAVPALVKWPGVVPAGGEYTFPASTLDYLPTLIDHLGITMPDDRPLDGISLLPLLRGEAGRRPRPIPYRFLEAKDSMYGSPTFALIDNEHKFLTNLSDDGAEDLLFRLDEDREESRNVLADEPERAQAMRRQVRAFFDSCRASHFGGDYPEPFTTPLPFQETTGAWV